MVTKAKCEIEECQHAFEWMHSMLQHSSTIDATCLRNWSGRKCQKCTCRTKRCGTRREIRKRGQVSQRAQKAYRFSFSQKLYWQLTLHKKWSFPLRISSVNLVTFTEEILDGKLHFLCSVNEGSMASFQFRISPQHFLIQGP